MTRDRADPGPAPSRDTPQLDDTLAADTGDIPRQAAPVLGQLIGRFVVVDVLGTGGMGVVYAAWDPHLDRKVAIKLLRAQVMGSDEARVRLLREAQAMARIDHPNVLRVHEAGTFGDQVYIAMEFAAGGTLRQWLAAEKRTVREIVEVFAQAGRGLAAAHAAGLVHRDFKPDNVLMFPGAIARVTDFGLVGVVGEQPPARPAELDAPLPDTTPLSQDLTRTGAVMGTPAYMAPEQFRGGLVGGAADQFAFSVALHVALYGAPPFAGTTFAELCANVIAGELVPVPRAHHVPPRIHRVMLRGLATDPARRYATLDELIADLVRDPSRRRRRLLTGAGVIALAIGAFAFVMLRSGGEAPCTGADERIGKVWNHAQQAKISDSFAASHRPDAAAVLAHTTPIVDRWSHAWQLAYVGACEDTRVRAIQSEHLLDLRMDCLTRRLDEVRATIDVLASGGADAVDHALDAVRSLPAVEDCANSVALTSAIAPPATDHARNAVAIVRAKLDQAVAVEKLGRYPAALELARGVLSEARSVGYPPIIAAAELETGTLQHLLADREAVSTLADAMRTAIAAGDTELAIRAASRRIDNLARGSAPYPVADEIAALATAIASHATLSARTMVDLDNSIGLLLVTEKQLDQAKIHLDRALDLALKQLGPDDLTTTKTQRSAAILAVRERRFADARRLFEQVLATNERIAGPNHPAVATALDNLANVYAEESNFANTKQLRERALAIRISALGPDHPDVAATYNNIGSICAATGDETAAKDNFEKALAILKRVYGDDSVEISETLVSIGNSLAELGDRAGARTQIERARALLEKAYGPDDPRLASVVSDLGMLTHAEHRNPEALALFQRAHEIGEKADGPNDPRVIDYLASEASVYTDMGKLAEARDLTLRVKDLMEKLYGPDHPRIASLLGNYGFLQLRLGDPAGALASFQRAQAIFEARLGKDHPNIALILTGVGKALTQLRRDADAVPQFERALAIATATHFAPGQIALIHFALAKALFANPATRARARTEARAALAGYQQQSGDDYDVADVKTWLRSH